MNHTRRQAVLFTVALISGAAILVVPSNFVRYSSAFVLLWLLPGLSWASLIPSSALRRFEWLVVGLGLSFVVTPATTLLVAYIPGPSSRAALVAATVASVGLPLVLSLVGLLSGRTLFPSTGDEEETGTTATTGTPPSQLGHRFLRDGWAWLLVAVILAAGLRLVNLDYSEFQGDEAKVMVRAAQALEGDDAVLFQHKKGPAQLTLVMPGWRLTGLTNEWMARLPFAWISILGVVAVFLFGQRLDRPHAGGIAACLVAVEGFLVGFGRIVQYQSIVFALSTLGLLCLLAYYRNGRGSLVIVGAAFFAGGALAHYDAVLALPAGLLLVGAGLWKDRGKAWRSAVPVAIAALVGAGIIALFYIPFMRSEYLGVTSTYMSGRIGGQVYNNLKSTFELGATYDSIYLLGSMILALAAQILATWARWGRLGLALSSLLLLAVISTWLWPERWVVSDYTLVWVPFVLLLVGALIAPNQPMGLRSLWLWFGLPALFFLFFVASPLTHVYTFFPALALLAGMALADLGRWLAARSTPALRVAEAGGVVLFVLCAYYALMMFVDHTPEYRRTFPQNKHPLYWTPYEQMPQEGLFGFPYRAGWKVVGYLMDEGQLAGSYDSNEKLKVTGYYTRQANRMDCTGPDLYITALNVQDEVAVPWAQIEDEYAPAIAVTVNNQPKLTVHKRDAQGSPLVYRVEEYVGLFDLGSTPDNVAGSDQYETAVETLEEYVPYDATVGDLARLLGYEIDDTHAAPGGYVELKLLWQVLAPTPIDYTVFTHLYDGQTMWGQLDGQPVCGGLPTSDWQPGQYVVDPYRITIREDAPPGPVPLTVGMYDLVSMQRLAVTTSNGTPVGDNVYITDIAIRSQ